MRRRSKDAPEPTKADLHHLAVMARTAADHHALEEYFTTLAKKNTAAAEAGARHRQLANVG